MCSPTIMAQVKAEVSRRRFLGMLGAAGTLAAIGGLTAHPQGATAQEATPDASPAASPSASPVALATPLAMGDFSRIADLTHTITPTFPVYPGYKPMEFNALTTIEQNGYYSGQLIFNTEHTGTHMDAPAHFVDGGPSADLLPIDRFIAPLAVVDVSARATQDADTQLTPDDILAWERQHGPLPAGAFVAMHSGWEGRLVDPASFINQDAAGTQHYPGFHPDAATMLVNERDIVGIGVDTLSLDYGAASVFLTHNAVLPAGKYGIEGLANLTSVPPTGATVIIGGPKHVNASGGPARVLALF